MVELTPRSVVTLLAVAGGVAQGRPLPAQTIVQFIPPPVSAPAVRFGHAADLDGTTLAINR